MKIYSYTNVDQKPNPVINNNNSKTDNSRGAVGAARTKALVKFPRTPKKNIHDLKLPNRITK